MEIRKNVPKQCNITDNKNSKQFTNKIVNNKRTQYVYATITWCVESEWKHLHYL